MHTNISVAGHFSSSSLVQREATNHLSSRLLSSISDGWALVIACFSLIYHAAQLGYGEVLCGLTVNLSCREGPILHQWPLENVVGASHMARGPT